MSDAPTAPETTVPHDDLATVTVRRSDSDNTGSGCARVMQTLLAIIGMVLIVIVVGIFGVVLTGLSTIDGLVDSVTAPFTREPDVATVTPSRTIINSLQPLGQLVSLSVEVAQADINVTVDSGGLGICSHEANHVAQAVIEAGVDITNIAEENIQYASDADRYTLTLPAPSITSCRIEYIRQYERNGGNPTCGIDWDEVRLLAQYEATVAFAQDTLDGGIVERAERETTLLMQSFVQALTGSEVVVEYADAAPDAILPSSCEPQIPQGWRYDDERNAWVEAQ